MIKESSWKTKLKQQYRLKAKVSRFTASRGLGSCIAWWVLSPNISDIWKGCMEKLRHILDFIKGENYWSRRVCLTKPSVEQCLSRTEKILRFQSGQKVMKNIDETLPFLLNTLKIFKGILLTYSSIQSVTIRYNYMSKLIGTNCTSLCEVSKNEVMSKQRTSSRQLVLTL